MAIRSAVAAGAIGQSIVIEINLLPIIRVVALGALTLEVVKWLISLMTAKTVVKSHVVESDEQPILYAMAV